MTQQSAVSELREAVDDETIAAADDAGVDVDAVLEDVVSERGDYAATTQARFATSALENAMQATEAEAVSGILMGCRDRHGKNWPRQYSLVRSNGEHLEVGSWESSLPGPKGTDVPLDPGHVYGIACEYQDEYDAWQAEAVRNRTKLPPVELLRRLRSVAVDPSQISRADKYEVVVIEGTVGWINPQTVFADGEADGDGAVLMPDGREPPQNQPHFELSLDNPNETNLRAHLDRQNVGKPWVKLPDADKLLPDAAARDTPEEQANLLQNAWRGVDVLIVGSVSSVDTTHDDAGDTTTYIDVNASAVIAPEVWDEPVEKQAEDTGGTTDDSIASQIETAANLNNEDPADLSVADVDHIAPALASEHSDEEIGAAVRELDADGTRGGADGGDDSDDSPIELLKANRADGMIKCPAEGCLAQDGSAEAICAHIEDRHEAADVTEWLEGRL